jgi:hypothetical protein
VISRLLLVSALLGALALDGRAQPPDHVKDSAPASGNAQPAAQAPGLAEPAFVLKPAKGFLDDPFAIDGEGEKMAVLRTDSASFALVEIVELATGRTARAFKAGDPQKLFERVLFAGHGGGIVVITRDPGSGRRWAQNFSPDGKPLGQVGPVTDFGTAARGEQEILVGWDRRPASGGGTSYVITQYRRDGLGRVGKTHAYLASKDGQVAQPPLKIIAWQDGYTQILGQRPGGYDKAKDVRRPDQAALFDVLSGSFVLETEIEDVLAWAAARALGRNRPNRSVIAVLDDNQGSVILVDAFGRRTTLALDAPVENYEPKSLIEQEEPAAHTLYFTLTLDPLNTEALARRKADKPYLDLYRVRQQPTPGKGAPAPTTDTVRLLRVPMDERPVAWVVGGRFFPVLRKHKSFSRGGTEIEVYRLP